MEQAIQIATSQTPGKVLQCSLVGESEDRVFYRVVILGGTEEKPFTTHVMVNAVNGAIVTVNRRGPEISFGTLNGKAVRLPNPEYPEIARAAKASGTVSVQVTIDEAGNVIAARAVSGHPLLQAASVEAARNAQFSPSMLNGQAVKVTGVVTYNFVAQ
jgi:TonB family protein